MLDFFVRHLCVTGHRCRKISSLSLKPSRPWFVYVIETKKRFLYTGIAIDVEKRFAKHRNGAGAKFFRIASPKRIVYIERCASKGRALRREAEIKRLSAGRKRTLLTKF